MTGQLVRYEVEQRVARIRFTRPEEANRITSTMMREFADALARAGADGADLLVLTAEGPDFSVGRDQHEVLPPGTTPMDNIGLIVEANRLLTGFRGVTVCAAQGRALGFGCGVVVQCDLSLVADTALLGFDEIHHGRAPSFVMSYLEDYVGPKRALDLVVTGRRVSAEEAERWGMVSRIVPEDLLAASTEALVEGLLGSPGELLARCKRYLREVRTVDPADRLDHALATFRPRVGGQSAQPNTASTPASSR
ncbi:enoyl-CoA hydratase/isomerase family protein [Actinomycetospora sp. TBRC 11914]|uniref:enoyl-CoA hydratase/isomerase family protein n=1 Tax=Actinomycetospora sp. TBRC 11914 TaxID=2729387 RepID=UPI00145E47B0|nr:enoyl-CoA hydratase/isomerase family protein [Actinomycetospora sp. TBRC 11914]NMO89484.1 enoyl-CoA hydratase/isomerase family protein [Actinomycetospora sp. TBRC 11914]